MNDIRRDRKRTKNNARLSRIYVHRFASLNPDLRYIVFGAVWTPDYIGTTYLTASDELHLPGCSVFKIYQFKLFGTVKAVDFLS